MAHAQNAARAHVVGIELDGLDRSFPRRVVMAAHAVDVGQDFVGEGRAGIEPHRALRELHRFRPQIARALDPAILDALHADRGEIGARNAERRIEPDRLAEEGDRGLEIRLGLLVIMRQPAQEAVPGGEVGR